MKDEAKTGAVVCSLFSATSTGVLLGILIGKFNGEPWLAFGFAVGLSLVSAWCATLFASN